MAKPAQDLTVIDSIAGTFFDMVGFPGSLTLPAPAEKSQGVRTSVIGMVVLKPFAFAITSSSFPSFLDDIIRKCHGKTPPISD
jgi:hypothetical protein